MTENNNDNYKFDGTGLSTGEKRQGKNLFDEYQTKYHIQNVSDISILNELVFREILQIRYKKKVEKYSKAKTSDDNAIVPPSIIKFLDENLAKVLELKKELGLLQENKGDDAFTYVQTLKEKFAKWREENQASREITCPYCSKIILLKIRTEIWESMKHPYFKDKILYSEHLLNLYLDKKITKEDVAKILGVSDYYITWLLERWHDRKEKENKSDNS
jgi:DNA-directed RNA polymerase subunit RPC12/RpoP